MAPDGIHRGSARRADFASFAEVRSQAWHHVAVVCHTRAGGSVQFYIAGRPDRRYRVFGPEATVHLTGVRLGGYNVWEKQPGANFHGALDDFRIYRGLLTEDQIRTLANECPEPTLRHLPTGRGHGGHLPNSLFRTDPRPPPPKHHSA